MHSTDRNQRKKRWCGICARAHPGAVDIHSKKCEDCKQKGATQVLFTGLGNWPREANWPGAFWLRIPIRGLTLARDLGQPRAVFVVSGARVRAQAAVVRRVRQEPPRGH
jgi:hypothetical protein